MQLPPVPLRAWRAEQQPVTASPPAGEAAYRLHPGITLGGSPFRYRATTRFFPWADIGAIVLLERRTAFGPIRYIDLEGRAGAPPRAGDGSGHLDRDAGSAPAEDRDALALRKVTAWNLSAEQLAAVIAAYAPGILIESARWPG